MTQTPQAEPDKSGSAADDPEQPVSGTEGATTTESGSTTERRVPILRPGGHRGRVVLTIALVILLAAGTGGYFWVREHTVPGDAAFAFGDRVVSTAELDRYVDSLRSLYGVKVPSDEQQRDQFRRATAKAYAVSLILTGEAKERGVTVSGKTIDTAIEQFISAQGLDAKGGRAKFVRALAQEGTSLHAVREEFRTQYLMVNLYRKVTTDQPVSEREIADAFAKHKEQLATPERRRLANIVVADERQADQVLAELRGGGDFGAVAERVSIDASTRDRGGELGEVAKDQLEAGYGKAAFRSAQGSLFGPVHTRNGWNVGKVLGVTPGRPAELAALKTSIRNDLKLEKRLAQWRKHITRQIHAADIEYADAYRPARPDAPPVTGSAGSPVPGGGSKPAGAP